TTTTRIPYIKEEPVVGMSYGAMLAQTMLLVALAIGVLTLGTIIGADYSSGASLGFFIAGTVMLLAQSFVKPLRHGLVGTTWLFAIALTLGLGLGPTLNYFLSVNPDVVAEAAGMTAVTVLGAACIGTFTSRDLAKWMRPLTLIVFVTVLVSWVMFAFGGGGNPIISGIIGLISAALIVVDFNYLRRRATEDDIVWIATGIFVSVLNIFLSFLNILDD
ncbi:MAG: US12 family protein, partial [Solirubrobacteraceae bacterium]|nr:US12 family protein [Solirubrobacteraceae bacterium]